MPLQNTDIAEAFNELADLLEIEGENQFRIRAYRTAARTIEKWPTDLAESARQGESLPKIPGVGKDLDSKIRELALTGRLRMLEEEKRKIPSSLLPILKIPSLGPRKVAILMKELSINSMEELRKAIRERKVRALRGFGERTEERIDQELRRLGTSPARMKLAQAEVRVRPLLEYLRAAPGVREVVAAGSFRRRQETIGDLDLLVSCEDSSSVMDRFVGYDDVTQVISQGLTRSTVILRSGIQVDLRAVPAESFGAALHYFTGSKTHNIALRTLGTRQGLKINEYGVFKGRRLVAGRTEEEIFKCVGLPWIEPEMREGRGELEAARAGTLPKLVTLEDIRGDLHSHTTATDGRNSLEEMARAAIEFGYEYLAITDHTQSLTVVRGQDRKRVLKQIREIDRLNSRLKGKIRLLKAAEVDILEDGSLDLPDDVLESLDLTVCSIHSRFNLSRAKQTERILRAMDHPSFRILGHPTGRLIDERSPYDIDLERILIAARDRGCAVELDSQPSRLDLNDTQCRLAKSLGVKISISSDAHSTADLGNLRYGVSQARRGWLTPEDIINTRTLRKLLALLNRK